MYRGLALQVKKPPNPLSQKELLGDFYDLDKCALLQNKEIQKVISMQAEGKVFSICLERG